MASDQHHGVLSDTELLTRSREGDSAAFGVLWERHRLAGIVAARGIAPTLDPDDLVSGAYLKIFELVRDGRGPTGAFRPYLYRVISSLAADSYRSAEFSNSHLDEVPDLTEAGPWEDGAFDLNAAARAFESLPERWQSVLWYSEVEGMAPRQIAPLLGLSANGVSALAARAKEGLQSAWVETHIDMQLSDEACRSTREQLQRYQLGKLPARRTREVAAHLEHCDACTAAAAEFSTLNRQLALVLATLLIGGAATGGLLKSLGALGVGASAATAVGPAGGAASLTTTSSAVGASAAGGIGIGTAVTAVAVTAALAAAAIGGVLITNAIEPASPMPVTEQPQSTPDEEPQTEAPADEARKQLVPPAPENQVAMGATSESKSSGETPRAPRPPVIPPVVPPVPPTLLAGYECYVPHVDSGSFELLGRSSVPGTVTLSMSTVDGAISLPMLTDTSGNWSTGPLSGIDGLISGTTTARVQLSVGSRTGSEQNVTATQCAGSGLVIDTSLQTSNVCFLDPANISLSGDLSEYGVIFARHVVAGSTLPISDPSLEGTQDPSDPAVIWSGILTGSDVGAPHFWWSAIPLAPYLGTDTDYNSGNTGTLELRVQTPDGRTSTWTPVEHLVSC